MRKRELTAKWLEREGFAVLHAREFTPVPERVRDTMGVYMILISGVDELLSRAGLPLPVDLTNWSVSGHQHIYTGESVGMRSRALLHLCGTARDSVVRETLLALQHHNQGIWPEGIEKLDGLEARLTAWLGDNALVAFRACDYVRDVERDLIARMPSPFNTRDNRKNALAPYLKALRKQFRSHLKATDQIRHRSAQPRSAWLVDRARDHLLGNPLDTTSPRSLALRSL
jgi:hypothetical protein